MPFNILQNSYFLKYPWLCPANYGQSIGPSHAWDESLSFAHSLMHCFFLKKKFFIIFYSCGAQNHSLPFTVFHVCFCLPYSTDCRWPHSQRRSKSPETAPLYFATASCKHICLPTFMEVTHDGSSFSSVLPYTCNRNLLPFNPVL